MPWSGIIDALVIPSAVFTVLGGVLWLLLFRPRPGRRHRYEVFVRAPAETVWRTYFRHEGRVDYRPGSKLIAIETIGADPLTVRTTVKMDYLPMESVVVTRFPLWEPPFRYREEILSIDGEALDIGVDEEGEFLPQQGGTLLRFDIITASHVPIAHFLAKRRVSRNLRALAAYFENQPAGEKRRYSIRLPGESWIVWAYIAVMLLLPRAVALPISIIFYAYAVRRGYEVIRPFL